MQMNDSFKPRLGNINNSAVLKMLSEQHAKARCGHGTGLIGLCQINKGERSVCGKQQALLTTIGRLYGKQQFISFRLGNFVNSSAQKGILQFLCHRCNGNSVKCHDESPF